jgi:CubicO group peptidase (beta-lactamase class C family)
MSRCLYFGIALLCACAAPGSSFDDDDAAPSTPLCQDQVATFEAVVGFMADELEAAGVPGGSLAIVCEGQLAFSAGLGVRERGSEMSVGPETRFQIASVTKMFTAAAGMTLVEDGTLSLHAPVSDVLPTINTEAPFGTPASLHHLLSHTAGYPTQFPGGVFTSSELATYFENNRDQPLWSPPGAAYNYSNLGMALAGLALETAAGEPFGDLVEQRVFMPAEMGRATLSVDTVMSDEDYARGHSGDATAEAVIQPDGSYYHTGYYGPMGGAWASAEDLARWAAVQLADGGVVMSSASMDLITTPHTPTGRSPTQAYGYGLFMDSLYGTTTRSHSGSVGGYLTDWKLVPQAEFAVVVTVNADWYWPGAVTDHALDAFGVRGDLDTSLYTYDPGEWGDLVGTYQDDNVYGTIVVTETASGLEADFVDRGFSSPLSPVFNQTFYYEDAERGMSYALVFWREAETGPTTYVVSLRGVGIRVED